MERDLAPLPAPLTPIIGRDSEIDVSCELLASRQTRLLTLSGPAGVGKTRLALEVASQLRDAFGERLSFVPLATLQDSAALPREIGSAFGIPDSVEPEAGLRQVIGRQPYLLLLDNLEQLPDGGLALSPMLSTVPGLVVLVTTRTRLEIAGEYVLPVEPLPVPATDAMEPDQLARNPAVQLLCASARGADATYELPVEELPVAAEITRRVDGLPLGLQLAGAQLSFLGARPLLQRLDRVLPLLGNGPRDQPERLQTMRDAIRWSYDLLTADEQAFFRRLCIFDGGFTLEMAETMSRGWLRSDGYPYMFGIPLPIPWWEPGFEGPDLENGNFSPCELCPVDVEPVAALGTLVQHHLIRAVRGETGIDRFELLETIREFGLEELRTTGEYEAVQHARAVLLTSIAEINGVAIWGAAWAPASAWITAELPNIRATLAWLAAQPSDANQLSLRILEVLWLFWQSRGYVNEGCTHLEASLGRPGGRPATRAQSLNLLGALNWIRNDIDRATSAIDEALPILERIDLLPGLGRNFLVRSLIAWTEGDYRRMEKMITIARDRFVRADDPIGPAVCTLVLAISARLQGKREQALTTFAEAHRSSAAHQGGAFTWGMAIADYYLGEYAREDGDRVTAVSKIRNSLETFLELGDPWTVSGCVGTLATYLIEDGNLQEAARLLGAAHGLSSSYGVFLPPTETIIHEAAARDVRERIGPDEFALLYSEGEEWSLQEAAAHAMAVPMESPAERKRRETARTAHPLRLQLTNPQIRTLQMLREDLSVKQIALIEGRKPTSIYERIDRIKEALGLPQETTLLALIRFVESYEVL